jgi:hypothetical protein
MRDYEFRCAMWASSVGAHDPSKNVAKLKSVAVYAAASASGGVGAVDRLRGGLRAEHHGRVDRAHRRG